MAAPLFEPEVRTSHPAQASSPSHELTRPRAHSHRLRNPQKLRILLIGGGGREHALAWKLSQSPRVEKVFVAPGELQLAPTYRLRLALELIEASSFPTGR